MFSKKNDADSSNDDFLHRSSENALDSDDMALQLEPSLLSAGVFIKGSISSRGPLNFHGTMEGEVDAPQIRLGENGNLLGKIQCNDLAIDGRIDGEIQCKTLVASQTANLSGTLRCESLRLQPGAQINGELFIGTPIEEN
jgi:cytoskeletal protein CcmA (bactofilin family)